MCLKRRRNLADLMYQGGQCGPDTAISELTDVDNYALLLNVNLKLEDKIMNIRLYWS